MREYADRVRVIDPSEFRLLPMPAREPEPIAA
jgi:hypothetical protein